MGRRTILLIAAVVVAALGTVLVFLYAQNARTEGEQLREPVQVLVAKSQIEVGTTGAAASSAGAFELRTISRANVVDGAVSDAAPLSELVALTTIFPGQQIIAQQWGAVGQTSGLALPDGTVALSLQLGDPQRVAGFVQPGSEVAIFTYGTAPGAETGSVRTLLGPVPVVAVGPSVVATVAGEETGANTEQIPTAILTLAVTEAQAQKLIFASGSVPGSSYTGLWFALMDDGSEVVPGGPGVTAGNLFS
jgi:pilus assembly protein CpaB